MLESTNKETKPHKREKILELTELGLQGRIEYVKNKDAMTRKDVDET